MQVSRNSSEDLDDHNFHEDDDDLDHHHHEEDDDDGHDDSHHHDDDHDEDNEVDNHRRHKPSPENREPSAGGDQALPPPLAEEFDTFHEDIFVLSLAASHAFPALEARDPPSRGTGSAPSSPSSPLSPFGDFSFADGMGTLKRLAQRGRKKPALRATLSEGANLTTTTTTTTTSPRYSAILSEQRIPSTIVSKMDHGRRLVMEGSAEELIQLLGTQLEIQSDYVDVFLCTFRYFTTPSEVLSSLLTSHQELCIDITSENRQQMDRGAIIDWNEAVERHILTVLIKWFTHHYQDFADDEELELRLRDFLQSDIFEVSTQANLPNVLERLDRTKEAFEKWRQETKLMIQYRQAVEKNGAAVMRKTSTKSIFDLSPASAVRALCLLEMDILRQIPAWELCSLAWVRKTCEQEAPLVYEHICLFNKISNWVATEVVMCPSLEARASLIEKFITMARQAREWNNFNTCFQIVLGLHNPAVLKLKATWAKVGRRHVQALKEVNGLVNPDKNHRIYRTVLARTAPPCVPYVGMYLKDLIFANDGSKLVLPNGHINFGKLNTIGMTVLAIRRFQDATYPFEDDSLIHWFRHHTFAMNDEELLAASKRINEQLPEQPH